MRAGSPVARTPGGWKRSAPSRPGNAQCKGGGHPEGAGRGALAGAARGASGIPTSRSRARGGGGRSGTRIAPPRARRRAAPRGSPGRPCAHAAPRRAALGSRRPGRALHSSASFPVNSGALSAHPSAPGNGVSPACKPPHPNIRLLPICFSPFPASSFPANPTLETSSSLGSPPSHGGSPPWPRKVRPPLRSGTASAPQSPRRESPGPAPPAFPPGDPTGAGGGRAPTLGRVLLEWLRGGWREDTGTAPRSPLSGNRALSRRGCGRGGLRQQVTLPMGASAPPWGAGWRAPSRPRRSHARTPLRARGPGGGGVGRPGSGSPQVQVSRPSFRRLSPEHKCQGWGPEAGPEPPTWRGCRSWGGSERKHDSPTASPTWQMLSPQPTLQASRARAQPGQLERIWAKEEKGLPPPPQLPSVALPDWLCVPRAQLRSLQTPSEPQVRGRAATRSGRGGREPRGWHLGGRRGRGARTGSAPQPPRGSARRVSWPPLLSAPRPFLPSQRRPPSSSSSAPPPPRPPPPHRFLIPATSALGGSFRGRRQPRGEALADAAGAARSRRRLVNGTRTGAPADSAAPALRRGPTAAARAHPPGLQVGAPPVPSSRLDGAPGGGRSRDENFGERGKD